MGKTFWDTGIGALTGRLGVAVGVMQEVSDPEDGISKDASSNRSADHPSLPAERYAQPSLPSHLTTAVSVQAIVPDASVVKTRFGKDLKAALQATPEKFHDFLEQKEGLVEALRETVPDGALEDAATKAAIKVSKLTIADVRAAMSAARAAQEGTKKDFDSWQQGQIEERVNGPNTQISQTEDQIKDLQGKIAALQGQINTLEAGIDPKRQAITQAQTDIAKAQSIFQQADAAVQSAISTMEQQLSTRLAK